MKSKLRNISRLLKQQKILGLSNLLGIIIGYISFFLVFSYCWYEKSFDKFHLNANDIYRLAYSRYDQQTLQYTTANNFYPTGRYLKENASGVLEYSTIARNYGLTVSAQNSAGTKVFFNEDKNYYVSSSFLSIFSYPVLEGNIKDLDRPNMVFITKKAAKKYFGKENASGKVITVDGGTTKHSTSYTVAGILEDLPSNTHLKFDFLFSMKTHTNELGDWIYDHWYGYDLFYTYIQLKPGTDPSAVQKILPGMVKKNYGDELLAANQTDIFFIQPVTSIHLSSNLEWETEKPGNKYAINILLYFSCFVLLITWINNINLTLARAFKKAKEVGIKKTLGCSRLGIFYHLVAEIALLNFFGIAIAALLLLIFYPLYSGYSRLLPPEVYTDLRFWLIICTSVIAGLLITSLIPSISLSGYKPSDVLKGRFSYTTERHFFRKALFTIQLILSFVLITGALVVYSQGLFLMQKDRGLNTSMVMAIRFPKAGSKSPDIKEKISLFRQRAESTPWVKDFTAATDIPEHEIETFGSMYRPDKGKQDEKAYFRIGADDNFFKFFKVKLVAGRFLSKEMKTDTSAYLLNESAVKKLGFLNPADVIGQTVHAGKKKKTIVGVVQDFHYRSVKVAPVATIFNLQENKFACFAIRLHENDTHVKDHIAELNKVYSELFPGNPFEYFFLEDAMAADLEADLFFVRIFAIFSVIAILISLNGLLGLVIVNLNQRVKELGIRKVIGADLTDISILIIKIFLIPILIALVISIPLSVWGFSKWISEHYLYHIHISWYYLAVPAVSLPLMSFTVILVQVYLINKQKAIKSLQYE